MKTRKKILVLSGLKNNIDSTIKTAVGIAKIIDAEVEVFFVKKPTEIVDKESQLSAMRTINREQIQTEKLLKKLIEPYTLKYDMDIKYGFSFGNVKNEISNHLDRSKPDMVVLGKRKSNPLNLGGDKITNFILTSFPGTVLIAPNNTTIEPQEELSIGILNADNESSSEASLMQIVEQANLRLRSFRIIEKGQVLNNEASFNQRSNEYVFEKNDSTVSKLSDYLKKSKVDFLYLNRSDKLSRKSGSNTIALKEIIKKVEVPMLLANESHFALN